LATGGGERLHKDLSSMRHLSYVTLICAAAFGCSRSATAPEAKVLPVKGSVTLDGKPLAGAQVMFLTGTPPVIFAGTTDDQGAYQLRGLESSLQGECKVTISRFVKPDGQPLQPGEPPAVAGAIEQLPPRYSQFDLTSLARTVPAEGGTFDFELESK
jgi:hypothetical protein